VMTRSYLDRSAILPDGEVLEQGVRPLEGYLGTEREAGELLITHLPIAVPPPGSPEVQPAARA
jgi:hypothetical protein